MTTKKKPAAHKKLMDYRDRCKSKWEEFTCAGVDGHTGPHFLKIAESTDKKQNTIAIQWSGSPFEPDSKLLTHSEHREKRVLARLEELKNADVEDILRNPLFSAIIMEMRESAFKKANAVVKEKPKGWFCRLLRWGHE